MTEGALIGPTTGPDLHVMSFNIRRALDGCLIPRSDRWSQREPAVRALLQQERPTLLGLQEALPRTMPAVRRALGYDYRGIGRGRAADGSGEGTPLLYDARRLERIAGGQRALSATPHAPGSRGWGNILARIMVWGAFIDRSTGSRLLVVNTHLDHLSARSRRRSAAAIREFVLARSLPAIVMGDLNAGDRSGAVRTLLASGALVDASTAAAERLTPAWGTRPGYRAPRIDGRRIDRILVTSGMRVVAAAANARSFDGRRPSDHLPVQAVVRTEETSPGEPSTEEGVS